MQRKTEMSLYDGESFSIYTPFTPEEVRQVLHLTKDDYFYAIRSQMLIVSIIHDQDPLRRSNQHSFWDVMEFVLLVSAGCKEAPTIEMKQFIGEICDELHSLFLAEKEDAMDLGLINHRTCMFNALPLSGLEEKQVQNTRKIKTHLEIIAETHFSWLFWSLWRLATTDIVNNG